MDGATVQQTSIVRKHDVGRKKVTAIRIDRRRKIKEKNDLATTFNLNRRVYIKRTSDVKLIN